MSSKRHIASCTILLVFWISATVFAKCRLPNLKDPDEMFDYIGREKDCIGETDHRGGHRGTMNDTFGNGIASFDKSGRDEGGRAVVFSTGGVIYVAGKRTAVGGNNNFFIAKFLPTGNVDTSFNTTGHVEHTFGSSAGDDWAHAIRLQLDGAIVVAGRSDLATTGEFDFAVLRLKTNGDLDTSFKTTGKSTIDFNTTADIARAMVIDGFGGIILAGYSNNPPGGVPQKYDVAFTRLLTNGLIDTTFASTGKLRVSFGTGNDGALSVSLDSNGKIVAGGNTYNSSANWDFAALRLMTSGALDTSFSSDGKTTFSILNAVDEAAYSLVIGLENQMYFAGATSNSGVLNFAVARLLSSGSLDTSFMTNGKKIQSFSSTANAGATGIALETSGNVALVAGYALWGLNSDFALMRLLSNGQLDATFSGTGKNSWAAYSAEDSAQAIAMKGNGVIMLAGRADASAIGANGYDFTLMRIQSDGSLAESGAAVKSFGTSGYVLYDPGGVASGRGLTEEPINGNIPKILLVGQISDNSGDMLAMRILIDGNIDTAFNTTGRQAANGVGNGADIAFKAIANATERRYYVGGILTGNAAVPSFGIWKLMSDGAIDTSFQTSGKYATGIGTAAYSIAQSPTSEIVMAGQDDAAQDLKVARFLNVDGFYGNLDTAFATSGRMAVNGSTTDAINHAVLDPNHSLLGSYRHAGKSMGMIRWTSTGALDTSFKTTGNTNQAMSGGSSAYYTETGGQGLALLSDNSSVIGYTASTDGATFPVFLTKFTSDGRLDTAFRTDGHFEAASEMTTAGFAVKALVPGPGDRFYFQSDTGEDLRTYRYLSDGSLDTSFATDGDTFYDSGGKDDPRGAMILDNGWFCGTGTQGETYPYIYCVWQ